MTPTKKIQVEAFYGGRYHAGCMVCMFTVGVNTRETPTVQAVQEAVRRHVLETGHECWIERVTTCHYSLAEATHDPTTNKAAHE